MSALTAHGVFKASWPDRDTEHWRKNPLPAPNASPVSKPPQAKVSLIVEPIERPARTEQVTIAGCAGSGLCIGCDEGLFPPEIVLGRLCDDHCREARPLCRSVPDELAILPIDGADGPALRKRHGGVPIDFAVAVVCPSGLVRYERYSGLDP